MTDPEPEPAQERGAHHVQSLDRGLAVLRSFTSAAPVQTLSDVARATGLTRAAARRFLLTLADLGYVRTDGKHFTLTARVLELGYAFLSSHGLPELAQPHLEQLSGQIGESSSLSVLDGRDVVYLARSAVSRIMTVAINIGTRFPAHATSMGHVLLAGRTDAALQSYLDTAPLEPLTRHTVTEPAAIAAELRKVRRQGWALVDQELEQGLRSVAVPVHDPQGTVVAAINVSTHASRSTLEELRRNILPALQDTRDRIERDLALTPGRRSVPS
jgi:IclR family transcriptional regulator, pca regulon regulatory protein